MTKKPPMRCIFCRGSTLTREHVIPDWIQEIIPKKPQQAHLFTTVSKAPLAPRTRLKTSRLRQGHPISRKVRVVCKDCNNGWLSTLENELKPLIKTLVLGEAITLTPWGQRRLATWAAKTSMTAEFIHPKSAAVTFEEREYLRLSREPMKTFNVWTGHYRGSRYTAALHHHSVLLLSGTPTSAETLMPPNTQATIIGLGGLFLQISSSSLAGVKFNLKNETASPSTNKLRRIWPPAVADLQWPPASSLSDRDIINILAAIDATFSDTI